MRWLPAHEAHAIERVGATWQFAENIPAKPWQSVLDRATKDLTASGFSPLQGVDFSLPVPEGRGANANASLQIILGPEGPVFAGAGRRAAPIGIHFQRSVDGELFEEVRIQRNHLGYSATRYDRWKGFRDRTVSLLGSYCDEVLPLINVSLIKLEYWDRFVFDGNIDAVVYRELLNEKSGYVPHFFLHRAGLWHSHIGFFLPRNAQARRLINMNIDAIDVMAQAVGAEDRDPRRSVGIYSMAQDSFGEGASPEATAVLGSTMDEMHTTLKAVLKEVITDQAAKRISLDAGDHT